jgi:hypothetical protein
VGQSSLPWRELSINLVRGRIKKRVGLQGQPRTRWIRDTSLRAAEAIFSSVEQTVKKLRIVKQLVSNHIHQESRYLDTPSIQKQLINHCPLLISLLPVALFRTCLHKKLVKSTPTQNPKKQ